MLHMSDPTRVQQLHRDRTARLVKGPRLRLPTLSFARLARRERPQVAARPATTAC
jgi:hypothetical protein